MNAVNQVVGDNFDVNSHTEEFIEKQYRIIAAISQKKQVDKFLQVIDAQLQKQPDNIILLLEKAHLYRRIAAYEHSRRLYSRIIALSEAHSHYTTETELSAIALSKKTASILAGEATAEVSISDFQPAPFIRYRNCFQSTFIKELVDYVIDRKDHFVKAWVNNTCREYNPKARQTWALAGPEELKIKFRNLLRENLSQYCQRLGMELFEPGRIEVKMTNHLNGGFFKPHSDNRRPFSRCGRGISYLYYFYRQPKRFGGGDLILFDTDLSKASYHLGKFTRVPCEHNSLVLFPSCWFHCVEPVVLAGNRFEDGRMAVSGHINYADDYT